MMINNTIFVLKSLDEIRNKKADGHRLRHPTIPFHDRTYQTGWQDCLTTLMSIVPNEQINMVAKSMTDGNLKTIYRKNLELLAVIAVKNKYVNELEGLVEALSSEIAILNKSLTRAIIRIGDNGNES